MNIALIVFGGKGTRINSLIPKQYIRINGHEVVSYTINVFSKHPLIDEIVLVTGEEYLTYTQNLVNSHHFTKVVNVVVGGETRQESVRKGLNEMHAKQGDNILIHDGDRPLISDKIITECLRKLEVCDALTVAIRSDESLKEVSNLGRKYHYEGVDYDIQTPQCFKYNLILDAHNRLKDMSFNDDASLILELGKEVELVQGDKYNFKVTTDRDLEFLKNLIQKDEELNSQFS